MNDKEKLIISKLVSLANKQQKLIHKLAQQALPPDSIPTSGTTFTEGKSPTLPSHLSPTALKPAAPTKDESAAILQHLPTAIKGNLADLTVHDGQVSIKWKTPVPDAAFNAVTKTVQNLQQQNVLSGKNYKVVEKA